MKHHHRCAIPSAVMIAVLTLMSPTGRLHGQATTPAAAPSTDPAKTEETVKLETFTVTGTNIKRLDMEKVLPVTVFSKDLIDSRNALTPVELLTALPQIT